MKIVALNSLAQALEARSQDSFGVITGSLYLVGEALELASVKLFLFESVPWQGSYNL